MSVVGVDFGTLNTVIAVARNRGVDVVCITLPYMPSISHANIIPDHK
jgi:molecular chaperone DnaK (HSP70)